MDAEVIVVGAGIGGLVTATQLAVKGIKVLVLEKYLIPGGSAGYFARNGYRFDVGASMIFGCGKRGTTNLLTRALQAVGQDIETIPDPVQVHYHLPDGLEVLVPRDYQQFIDHLSSKFPHERVGIKKFYDECWQVFNCLNSIELLSLEEWRYLLRVFVQNPLACLGLVRYLPQNVGAIARRYIRDPLLLKFIDIECYIWSVVPADKTPMINAGMVFSDRHYGGINYPKGGVGQIAERLVAGLRQYGGEIYYSARVTKILPHAHGVTVELANGKRFSAKKVISNATRWDTFGQLLGDRPLPPAEQKWQINYQKSPSFLSLHLGITASALPPQTHCHHVLLDDWDEMEQSLGTIFVSIPTLLDPSLAPPDHHIIHAFSPSWIAEWQGLSPSDYAEKKETEAGKVIQRLQKICPAIESALDYLEIGTPKTHRRFLGRIDGTYGPMPQRRLWGLLPMPFNRTAIPHLYCVGDSTFPGQGLNAVAFSGFACAHLVSADLGRQ
jgi:prolycopene isomerase